MPTYYDREQPAAERRVMLTVTPEDRTQIRLELDVLHAELTALYQVEPVSRAAAERLIATRERVIGEMRRLERLLAQ